ncbi:protein of unknown function [Xenorhabdus doucetiae]|uniref:Uncharacterized protein n=1 Tax=Xenorhabdus doucetiae TaxID=351671 RepID=A0A068QX19_9GAMM|nr:protein of unknown function [Xenorhabdus doucetiae]
MTNFYTYFVQNIRWDYNALTITPFFNCYAHSSLQTTYWLYIV